MEGNNGFFGFYPFSFFDKLIIPAWHIFISGINGSEYYYGKCYKRCKIRIGAFYVMIYNFIGVLLSLYVSIKGADKNPTISSTNKSGAVWIAV